MRAAMNAAWLDELVPLMYHAGCAILFVGRESDDPTADARDRQFGNDWKLTGGKALFFDSSLVARVSNASMVYQGPREDKFVVGEKHVVEIHKTKVSARQDRVEKAYFHTSNGALVPEGFDRARDLLELGVELGVVKQAGAWYSFDGRRFQGEGMFVKKASPELLDALDAKCREKFAEDVAARADVVGGT
jgi:recombination protein RecA